MLSTTAPSMHLTKIVFAATLFLSSVWSAEAGSLIFDPDAGGNSVKLSVNTFQYGAGNSLLQGALPFTSGDSFQLLYHGQLNSVVTDTGAQITPAGLNAAGTVGGVAPYEITVVLSATETVTETLTNFARFELSPAQVPNSFIEIYYDPNQNANALAGTGYNDGMLILRAVPNPNIPNTGMFSQSNAQPSLVGNFDNFDTNDFVTAGPGGTNVTPVLAAAATKLQAVVTYVNSSFFVTPVEGDVGRRVAVGDVISFDLGQAAPIDKSQPSRLFVGLANAGTSSGPAANVTPSLGARNGTSGPDAQFQTIAAASISAGTATPTRTPAVTQTPSPTTTSIWTTTSTPTPSATPTPGPAVSVITDKFQIKEGRGDATLTFTVFAALHPDITINYSTRGTATLNTDYTLSGTPGQVVVPANVSTAAIAMHAIFDGVKEGNETARVVIGSGSGYVIAAQPNNKVSITILDSTTTPTPTPSASPTPTPSPIVSVVSDKGQVREGHDAVITFAVAPTTHAAITVNYSTLGTATLNTDYTLGGTPGQVTIPLNQSNVSINLHAIFDGVTEANGETARVVIGAGSGYGIAASPNNKAVVTILDSTSSPTPTPSVTPTVTPTPTPSPTPTPFNPVVTVTSDKAQIREGHDAFVTFTATPTTHAAITVNYSTLGTATLNTDYTLSGTPGQVVIPANQPNAIIDLHAVTDTVKETNGETARIVVGAGSGYSVPAAPSDRVGISILDPP